MRARLLAAASVLTLVAGATVGLATPAGAASTVNFVSVTTSTGVTGTTTSTTASVVGDIVTTVTGTLTYTLFTGGTCAGTALATSSPQAVTADGNTFPQFAPGNTLGAGTYSFQAQFNGPDSNGNTTGTNCSSFTVGAATPTLSTAVNIAGTSTPWGASQPVGTSAQDTATLSSNGGIVPTGTVTYDYYTNASCSGTAIAQPVTLLGGNVPSSNGSGPLASGSYSFKATYSGDANYNGAPAACEAFSVAQSGSTSVSFSNFNVNDAGTNLSWSNESVGAIAYQTITVNGVAGVTPTGTVTATLFPTANCTSTAVQALPISLVGGSGQTAATSALSAGSFSFQDVYNGDANYAAGAVSTCLPFNVAKGTPVVASTVYQAGGTPWPANPSPGSGASAYDTATVSQASGTTGFPISGSVTFNFYQLGTLTPCTGAVSTTETLSLSSGAAKSSTTAALNKGSYAFQAVYTGNGNWNTLTGTCETFNVAIGTPNAPKVTNIPGSPVEFDSFQASVSTNGDGQTSVASNTTGVCTVGADGHTVTFVLYGTCSLTAVVGVGTNYGAGTGTSQLFSIVHAPRGYWLVGSDGGIFSFGAANFFGSMGGISLQRPVVGITPATAHGGYWLVATDGGVFSFGPNFYGSIPGVGLHPAGSGLPNSLNAPIVGIVPSTAQHGYFMVATDGGVFAFGDAHFAGSCPGIGGCAGSAVAVMPDHSGNGYWLVTNQGAVYAFGDAQYYGSSRPFGVVAVDAVATPDGGGYWILYANGTVLSFGDASPLGAPLGYVNQYNPATAIFPTADGHGYWVSAARGDVFTYGNAIFYGGMAATNLNGGIIAADGF